MARMVATKAALSIRVDALTDSDGKSDPMAPTIGLENRAKLESRLRALEHQGDLGGARSFASPAKNQSKYEMVGETKTYNTAADAVGLVSTQRDAAPAPVERAMQAVLDVKEEKRRAKEERRAKRRAEKEPADANGDAGTAEPEAMDVDGAEASSSGKDKKKKKVKEEVSMSEVDAGKTEKKRKRSESEVNGDAKPPIVSAYYYLRCQCQALKVYAEGERPCQS